MSSTHNNERKQPKVLILATSKKTRGGISAVINRYKDSDIWNKYHCKLIETTIDTSIPSKMWRLLAGLTKFVIYAPFYDIVHIHSATQISVRRKEVFHILAKLLGKRTIIHIHCNPFVREVEQKLYYRLLPKADVIITLSNGTKKRILQEFNLNNPIEVLYNPMPEPKHSERIVPIALRKKQFLYAAFLDQNKGYTDLLKAFAKIAPRHCDWKLVMAGEGELTKAQETARLLHIDEQVEFPGWVRGDDKEQLFANSAAYCLASYAEGFPMAVVEAWSYGTPVICTPVGGLPDIAKDEENALLFTPGNIEQLAAKMEKIITDQELCIKLAEKGLALAKEHFDFQVLEHKLDSIYQLAMQKKSI